MTPTVEAIATQDAVLLEDGSIFYGVWRGYRDLIPVGEGCFNTSMTGYQEILTDPSYAGQLIIMTYPMIGNYGISAAANESKKVHAVGFVVREISEIHSNFTSEGSLEDFLIQNRIPCLSEVDTRALTRALRSKGSMRCTFLRKGEAIEAGLERMKAYDYGSINFADLVSKEPQYILPPQKQDLPRVAVLDFGVKRNILNLLSEFANLSVYNLKQFSELDLTKENFSGYFLSNGPGDPEAVDGAKEQILRILDTQKPLFGICLGHQLLSLALGAKTYKLKFGHRGANHPVQNQHTRAVEVSSQNHGYAVDPDSVNMELMEITHINLNDKTVSGIGMRNRPVFSVQYHPEASPGPHDSRYLFAQFKKALNA